MGLCVLMASITAGSHVSTSTTFYLCIFVFTHTHKEYTSHSERVSVRMSGSRQKELRQNPNKKPCNPCTRELDSPSRHLLSIQTKVNVSNTCIPFCLRSVHASCRILNTCELLKVSFCWSCFCISFCTKPNASREECVHVHAVLCSS